MSENWCNTCGKFMFSTEHHCSPVWDVFIEDCNGKPGDKNECPYEIYASDEEDAAEQAVDKYDSEGDYTCIGGDDVTVHVRDEDGRITHWIVSGESVPRYHANQVLDKEDTDGGLRKPETKSSDITGQSPAHKDPA